MGLFRVIKNLLLKKLFSDFMGIPRITISNLGFVTINGNRYKRVKIRFVNANKIDNNVDNLLDEISELKKCIDQLDQKIHLLQTLNINLSFENDREIRKNRTLEADVNGKHEIDIKSYQSENDQLKATVRNKATNLRILIDKNRTLCIEKENLNDKIIELGKQIRLLKRNDKIREEHMQAMRAKYERVIKANFELRKLKKNSHINE